MVIWYILADAELIVPTVRSKHDPKLGPSRGTALPRWKVMTPARCTYSTGNLSVRQPTNEVTHALARRAETPYD